MPTFSHYPLQQSIYQALTADSQLMSLVVGVFDRVPQGTAYPYVTIGESVGSDWSTKTTSGMEQNVSLHIWSRQGGRAEAANIMTRIHTLLHEVPLTVIGQTLVSIRFSGSGITLENDGWTYQGVMKFQAFLQAS
jgi:hypothetical protein